jgi:5'-3' exonuclease
MGVLEFFGSLVRHNITSSSIHHNYTKKMIINHFFIDFNSIIHVSSQKVINDINKFLQLVLHNLYRQYPMTDIFIQESIKKYQMEDFQKTIKVDTDPKDVITYFHNHFEEKLLDKLIITFVINYLLHIIRTYCDHKYIKTLFLAIDGVPSKSKMIEQKQRRYMGAVMEGYEKKILKKYKEYLLEQDDFAYLFHKNKIEWSRSKITPGTGFMDKLVKYLRHPNIIEKLKTNRSQMEIILSDMYEIGEGEKKIINYLNLHLKETKDIIAVYSPDADMILLCMLLRMEKIYVLRYDQPTDIFDLINIRVLKDNISYYLNNHPDYSKQNFEMEKINRDLVCISSLFGNDFVPKIETVNVRRSFENILDAYLQTLIRLKNKNYYLVHHHKNHYTLNLVFLKNLFKLLLPLEEDFILYNKLYNQYINLGQIKNVLSDIEITPANLVSVYQNFTRKYGELKHAIEINGNYSYFESDEQFMNSLKKGISIIIDGQRINTVYLSNGELVDMIIKYYHHHHKFPKLNINLNTYSHSIEDPYHQNIIKDLHYNNYQKELYKFRHMLDEYVTKLNSQPLELIFPKIKDYYTTYFGVDLYDSNKQLSIDAMKVMRHYISGLLWVFNYYFNDPGYINYWYYYYEKAPLIKHISTYLDSLDEDQFNLIFTSLEKYKVTNLRKYFNPLDQLVYVSPLDICLTLLPKNYQKYLMKHAHSLLHILVDIHEIINRLWEQSKSSEIDCHSIMFLNKCIVSSLEKTTRKEDEEYLNLMHKIPQNNISLQRSKNEEPNF